MKRLALPLLVALCACPHPTRPDLSADPKDLLREVRASQAKVKRVQGGAKVKLRTGEANGTVQEFLAAQKPYWLHMEVLDFFGNVAAVLVTDEDSFSFYDARAGAVYRGKPTPENVSRVLPVSLSAPEMVSLLCGSVPLPGETARLALQPAGERVALVAREGERIDRLEIGDESVVEAAQLGGPRPVDLVFSLFRHHAGTRVPTAVVLDSPGTNVHVEVSWKDDLDVNGEMDPALFKLDPPRGARIVELGERSELPRLELPLQPEK